VHYETHVIIYFLTLYGQEWFLYTRSDPDPTPNDWPQTVRMYVWFGVEPDETPNDWSTVYMHVWYVRVRYGVYVCMYIDIMNGIPNSWQYGSRSDVE
jgi:hypothetical protein